MIFEEIITPQKAVEVLENGSVSGTERVFAIKRAIIALKKQVPRKVEFGNGLDPIWDVCSTCKCEDIAEQPMFCPDCGQALDWSDEDENNNNA